MKAITLWQPWASLLACGAKQYETRSWATSYRGEIAIHAGIQNPNSITAWCLQKYEIDDAAKKELNIMDFMDLPRGFIIATAELVGCWKMWDGSQAGLENGIVCIDQPNQYWSPNWMGTTNEYLFGDWTPGRYAWEFSNMKMLNEPIPAKGLQRLWNWEPPKEIMP